MLDREKENRIIELRAKGKSYTFIAQNIGVGKQTALDVCRKNKERVATLAAFELEEFYQKQKVTSEERVASLASLMRKIREELDKRDLSDVPTEKLIELYLKQAASLKEEIIEPKFSSSEEQILCIQERELLCKLSS